MGNFTAVVDKAVGDVFTQPMWATYIEANLNKGVNRPLGDFILGASAATLDFTPIDQNFAHLQLEIYARSDRAATLDSFAVRFNGDAGANYNWLDAELISTGVSNSGSAGDTSGSTCTMPGNTATANRFAHATILIPYYAGAVNHKVATALGSSIRDDTVANFLAYQEALLWKNVAAITRVTVISRNGANFVAGSRATLTGIAF